MDTPPARAPPVSRVSVCRSVSKIRAVCTNQRTYGSGGVSGNWYPYRDRLNILTESGWGVMVKISRLALIAFLLGGSLLAWGKRQKTIKYRNTASGVAYTGSKSCAGSGCHEEICRNYYRTPHGNSMGPANAPSELAKVPDRIKVYAKKQDRYFEVVREGPDLYQTQYQLDESGNKVFASTHKLEYRIGGHLAAPM